MAAEKAQTALIVGLALVAGIAIGAAGTLLYLRDDTRSAATSAINPGAKNTATGAPAARAGSGVFINEKEITPEQSNLLLRTYGAAPPPGHYWYDSRSGLYGLWGYEAAGFIRPGHDFGSLPSNASKGGTGVFLNGREINMNEARYVQSLFGAVYQGNWWLDGQTGNIGVEGNPMPVANLILALQQAQQRSGGGDSGYRWRDGRGSFGGTEGNCTWISVPGAEARMSSGCN